MMVKEEFVRTAHPKNIWGVRMKRCIYDAIKEFILTLLAKEKELTINSLIEKGYQHFVAELRENSGWYLYQVKLDLEARGLIKHQRRSKKSKKLVIIKSAPITH